MSTVTAKDKKPKKKKQKKLKWLFRDALLCTLLSLLVFTVLANLILSLSYFNPLLHAVKDFSFLDAYYSGNFSGKGKIDSTLVLVNIGDLNRQGISELIEAIDEQKPEVIGLDVLFEGKKTNDITDSGLLQSLNKSNLVMAFIDEGDRVPVLGDFLPLDPHLGYVNLTSSKPTEVIRGFEGINPSGSSVVYALSSQLIRRYKNGVLWKGNEYSKRLKNQRRIKFYGHFNDFVHIQAEDLLAKKSTINLKDKIVLVGYAGYPENNPYDVEDKHFTPLNPHPLGKGIPDMYGMTIHANITNMLLQNDFFWELDPWGYGFLIFIFSYLTCLYLIWLDRRLKISYRTVRKLFLFVFAVFFVGLCLWLFSKNIAIEPSLIVMITIFSAGFVKYYKHLVRYIKTKRRFKSYLK